MKRDLELIRTLALRLEAMPAEELPVTSHAMTVDGVEQVDVVQAFWLMRDGGFLYAVDVSTRGEPRNLMIHGLNWQGFEFLDSVRDEGTWKQARQKVLEKAGSVGVEVLMQFLRSTAARALGMSS